MKGIRVDSGWTIDCNIIAEQIASNELLFDDTLIFTSINKVRGLSQFEQRSQLI